MKTEENGVFSSRVDMSLDDIIKLNRKQTRRFVKRGGGTNLGKRQQFITANRNISASRFSGWSRNKQNTTNAIKNRVARTSISQTKQLFTINNRNNRSAALAVLRRARQTAAAAAKAASDAAALIERSRVNRQRVFDQRRPIQLSGVALEKRPMRRTTVSLRARRYRGAQNFNKFNPLFTRSRRLNQSAINLPMNKRFSRTSSIQHVRGRSTNGTPNNDNYPVFRNGSRSARPNNNNNNTRNYNSLPRGRSNNADYLAQARALIQAQNERSQGYHFQSSSAGPRRRSNKNVQRRKGLNYYAQFWENHH